jgi:hypothetical protein
MRINKAEKVDTAGAIIVFTLWTKRRGLYPWFIDEQMP